MILSKDEACRVSLGCGIQFTPVLFIGTFEECLEVEHVFRSKLTPEDFEGENEAEGVVIEPVIPTYFDNGNRIYFKKKTEAFTERKKVPRVKQVTQLNERENELLTLLLEYSTTQRVSNVISKFGTVTNKDFNKLVGLTIQDVLEEFHKENDIDLKKEAEENWQRFNKMFAAEVGKTVREQFLKVI
jgi:Rnl2 family RNA ligase